MLVQQKTEILKGRINRIIYKDENTGFHILSVETPNEKSATIKVTRPSLFEDANMQFSGKWIVDPKYGRQFLAESCKDIPPSTKEGLISYLSSSFFNQIGPIKARRIVDHFGDKTMDILDNDIKRLTEVKGISESIMENIKKGWDANKEINEIMQFLMDHNINAALAGKIYEHYREKCVNQMMENPYDLALHIRNIGFKKADKIALSLGFSRESTLRIGACIIYSLERAEDSGHCFLYKDQIKQLAYEYLGDDINIDMDNVITSLESEQKIISQKVNDEIRYYNKRMFYNEEYCGQKVSNFALEASNIYFDDEEIKKHIKESVDIDLSDEQFEAIKGILTNKISVLTGGPGVGKTSTTQALVEVLCMIGKKMLLCAPTGRAAKRMTQVIGEQASTIHRLLSWDPSNGGFAHNENNPLSGDFLIVDESSMVDIHLAASLLRAVPEKMSIVFIGDKDQLPPVGPGNFFKDLIESEKIPTYRLTKIFRQGKDSKIITYSHMINSGDIPNINSPLLDPELWKNKEDDCLFIDSGFGESSKRKGEYPKWSSLRYGYDLIGMVEKIYKDTIPEYFAYPDDIQVLIPMKKGPVGSMEINKKLQAVINPPSASKEEIKIIDTLFREHDKVIQTANNYELNVFNGDIGRIIAIDKKQNKIQIKFGEDQIVNFERNDMVDLELGYIITIHKSQGSEFDYVILPLVKQYSRMLYKNLIYTGLTRAKKLAIFVGQRDALSMAVKNTSYKKRQSSLRELIEETINAYSI